MTPDPSKIEAIVDLEPLRRIIGMANYLGLFVPNLSDLLKSRNTFLWGPSQEESFLKLKEALTAHPVFVYYDMT